MISCFLGGMEERLWAEALFYFFQKKVFRKFAYTLHVFGINILCIRALASVGWRVGECRVQGLPTRLMH